MTPAFAISLAVVTVLIALIFLPIAALIAWIKLDEWLRRRRNAQMGMTELEARENTRPHLDPITPIYYGMPPHNGHVADSTEDLV
jgi:hypothetical protein